MVVKAISPVRDTPPKTNGWNLIITPERKRRTSTQTTNNLSCSFQFSNLDHCCHFICSRVICLNQLGVFESTSSRLFRCNDELTKITVATKVHVALLCFSPLRHNNEGLVQMIFLFNWVIFRFHVNLPGCSNNFRFQHRLNYLIHWFVGNAWWWVKPKEVLLKKITLVNEPLSSTLTPAPPSRLYTF